MNRKVISVYFHHKPWQQLVLASKIVIYEPKPIDTNSVELTDDLVELTEKLAENTHDHWANLRISEGWRWGPVRNDMRKEHPDIVPYAELTDSEKEYDRKTAIETLKAIIALGYKIERVS